MRAIAFSVGEYEEPLLHDANQNRHELTLLTDPLTVANADQADGYDAVLVSGKDDASEASPEKAGRPEHPVFADALGGGRSH
jgi:D-lactate dehydrogenase